MPRISLAPPNRTQIERSPGGRDPDVSANLRPPLPASEFRKRVWIPPFARTPPIQLTSTRRTARLEYPGRKYIVNLARCQVDFLQNVKPIRGRPTLALYRQETYLSGQLGSMASVRGNRINAPSNRRSPQKVNFNPSCNTRLLPEPTSGLPAATSGVAHPQPNVLGVPMSLVPPDAPP